MARVIYGYGAVKPEKIELIPPTAGEFWKYTIERRKLTREDIAQQTGIDLQTLADLETNKCRFDKEICQKLEPLFSTFSNSFLTMQTYRDFYEEHGRMFSLSSHWRQNTQLAVAKWGNKKLTRLALDLL